MEQYNNHKLAITNYNNKGGFDVREKGKSSVAKLLYYAGGHKRLTVLGCTLSGIAAVLSMAPYICIWYVVRGVFAAMPDYRQAGDLVRYGWYALWFALGSAAI